MPLNNITIRTIQSTDNAALASIIRNSLAEFGANKPGTVYYDESTDSLSDIFTTPKSIYYVALQNGEVLGGGGIYPTQGLGDSTCELVKMYLLPKARGMGIGALLLQNCVDFALAQGYKNIYIETMPELSRAVQIYEQLGFKRLTAPLGQSGHFGCDIWMLKKIAG